MILLERRRYVYEKPSRKRGYGLGPVPAARHGADRRNGTFRPDSSITRAQVATILKRFVESLSK